jgi:glucose 1-dehydrogenase
MEPHSVVDVPQDQRVVLVTGGGGGIGRATSLAFASKGAKVAVADMNMDKAQETAQAIMAAGGEALALGGDVACDKDVQAMINHCTARWNALDVLINNAGICPQVHFSEMSLEVWNRILSTNLTSMFLTCREVIPHMLARGGGSIVNVSSVHAMATIEGHAAYAASKGGVLAFTRALALDYAKRQIRVNAVLPGAIHTPMLEGSGKKLDMPIEVLMETWKDAQPIGRVGTAEEVAEVILFAANPANSFMTGAALVVDGGMTIEL